jgi:phosphate/phosphite/phosphonate ABC transporter binding protein
VGETGAVKGRLPKWAEPARTGSLVLAAAVALFLAVALSVTPKSEQAIKVGVLAHLGKDDAARRWAPTATYLSKRIPQYRFQIVPLAYDEIFEAVDKRRIDFVLVNPSMYVELESRHGVAPLATLKERLGDQSYSVYGGVIFTRSDNTAIRSMGDLRGKRFAAVDKDAVGGWLAAYREMRRAGLDPQRDLGALMFAGSHDKAVFAVLNKETDAGTCRTAVIEQLEKAGRIRTGDLRIIVADNLELYGDKGQFPFLASTRLYPEWAFAKLAGTPADVANRVSVALLDMSPDDPAAVFSDSAGWTYPLNYQPVRELMMELKIGYYRDFGKTGFLEIIKRYWVETLIGAILFVVVAFSAVTLVILNKQLTKTRDALRVELSERRLAEAALRESENQYRDLYENAPIAYLSVGTDGRIGMCNGHAERLLGRAKGELVGRPVLDLYAEGAEGREKATRILADFKKGRAAVNEELQMQDAEGNRLWVNLTVNPVLDGAGHVIESRAMAVDVTARRELEEKFRTISIVDELTELYNRRGFITLVEQQLKVAARTGTGALFFFSDLDDMKSINDTYGHQEGDQALMDVALIFRMTFRESDIIGRMGGDEFAVLAVDAEELNPEPILARLRRNLEVHCAREGRPYRLSLSVGVAYYDPEVPLLLDDLMARADKLMYDEKRGRS